MRRREFIGGAIAAVVGPTLRVGSPMGGLPTARAIIGERGPEMVVPLSHCRWAEPETAGEAYMPWSDPASDPLGDVLAMAKMMQERDSDPPTSSVYW